MQEIVKDDEHRPIGQLETTYHTYLYFFAFLQKRQKSKITYVFYLILGLSNKVHTFVS